MADRLHRNQVPLGPVMEGRFWCEREGLEVVSFPFTTFAYALIIFSRGQFLLIPSGDLIILPQLLPGEFFVPRTVEGQR